MNTSALHKISYGLYIIGARKDDRKNAQVANSVVQVSAEPATISVCLNKNNLTHELVTGSRFFSVSVLAQDTPLRFIGNFGFKSGRDTDKLEGVKYLKGITGAPVVTENAVAYLEAEVIAEADVHTHTIFIGKLVAAEVLGEGEPMTYAYYHQVKRGTTPKSAPSYVAEAK
jgi:flavin reductase (DIM6/NTAB) family NADH-FMN oxidoreductase RutF